MTLFLRDLNRVVALFVPDSSIRAKKVFTVLEVEMCDQ